MHYYIGSWKPIACSKCGSHKAVKPLNEPSVDIRCLDCGHQKLAPTPPTAAGVGSIFGTAAMPKADENPKF